MSQAPSHATGGGRPAGGRPGGAGGRPPVELPDISEKGAPKDGVPQKSDERLYMQLLAYTGCQNSRVIGEMLQAANIEGAVYEDLNDPRGIAVLTFSKDPNHFIDVVRREMSIEPFSKLKPVPEYTMFGRTYSLGYEPDLQEVLVDRPRRHVLTKDWPWVVFYPLRRSGKFEQLPHEEQREILKEHGTIGMGYGAADFAHDIRLACHGLDKNDNDFVIGLLGKDLHPLSALVQRMRKTQQTSLYLERLGPFFVGRTIWQSKM